MLAKQNFKRKPEDYVQAGEKLKQLRKKTRTALGGADTIVVVIDSSKIIWPSKILTTPQRMLQMLSGRWHEVLTGVALVKRY